MSAVYHIAVSQRFTYTGIMLRKDEVLQIAELLEPIHKKLDKLDSIEVNLKGIATKDDIKDMVTKSYLESNNRILGTIIKIELQTVIKNFSKEIKKTFQETISYMKEKEQQQDSKLENHENRIHSLEVPHKN